MKALWLDEKVRLRRDLPLPQAGGGEALVRVRLAGVCGTDLELMRGYYPFIGVLGHEFVGEIAEAPDAPERVWERVEMDLSALVGSRCGPFAPALRLLEQGPVDPLPLIDGRFALDEGEAALSRAAEPEPMKVLLECS